MSEQARAAEIGAGHAAATGDDVADMLVIGGGVNGAGIARDAAGRGYHVVLCEAGDLAGATSSSSSKLIHGGLRYLEHYEFRLVREALAEREVLLASAPHLIYPLRFVLPHHRGLRPAWMLQLGLFLYDHLGGRKRLPGTRSVDLRHDPVGRPLNPNLRRGFEYSDCWVDDARLVALLAVDAAERGARILTRTRCLGALRQDGTWRARLRLEDGREQTVKARALVNAAGPWVAEVARTLTHAAPSTHAARLVKGSHIIIPRLYEGAQCYTLQSSDGRVVFTVPYQDDYTLVGTTDLPFEADPAQVSISAEEGDYLCRVLSDYFPHKVEPLDIVWSYAGVRALHDSGQANTSAVTRDYVFDLNTEDGAPALSIYGGKITTFRRLAEHALSDLGKALSDRRPAWTQGAKLPGGDLPGGDFEAFRAGAANRWPWLGSAVLTRLCRAYGTRMERLLDGARAWSDLGRDFGAGLTQREVEYLIEAEWAKAADDVLWRRSKLGLHMSAQERKTFAEWLEVQATPALRAAQTHSTPWRALL